DMTDVAGAMLKGINEGRRPHSGSSNTRGMIWDIRLTSSDEPLSADGQPANFERDPNSPQYLVLAYPRDEINGNLLLYDVARFNFSSFVVRDFDLEPMSFGNVGLLIVKGFDNLKQLEHYRSVMEKSPFSIPEGVRPVMISKANFELLLREGRSFEEYFRFEEEDRYEAVEESVLEESPADDAPPTESSTQPQSEEETTPSDEPTPQSEEEATPSSEPASQREEPILQSEEEE
ncbi:MAG: hypothetical protein K2J70_02010, partial [Muribaculaceae bacterium]|nr:hypothetical protein [Muribaculaceae bacterium]